MEDTLSKLLAAEDQAQKIIDAALRERDSIVNQAMEEARHAEQQFADRVPEIHQSFIDKAQERARHSIAEMERRFSERQDELQHMAQENHDGALAAALAVMLGEKPD